MSWEIICKTDYIDYSVANNEDESFFTSQIVLSNREIHQEPSSEYKAPKDDVMVDTYIANSEHGIFQWTVTARRTGFNSFAEIEDIILTDPNDCEALSSAYFDIESD